MIRKQKIEYGVGKMIGGPLIMGVTSELQSLTKYLEVLQRGGIEAMNQAAARTWAEHTAELVRAGYRTIAGAAQPLGTQQVYMQGKQSGKTPGRWSWGITGTLKRSKTLSESVVVIPEGKGFTVCIDPDKGYGAGDAADAARGRGLLARVGEQMENPRPQVIQASAEAIAYLQVLKRGEAGPPGAAAKGGAPQQKPIAIVIWPRPVPVWAMVKAKVRRDVPPALQKIFWFYMGVK